VSRSRGNSNRRSRAPVAFGFMALMLIAAVAAMGLYARGQLEPASASHGKAVTLAVASGEALSTLASDLEQQGLVRSAFWFEQFARIKGLSSKLQPGGYLLDSGMGPSAIIAKLEGKPDTAPGHVVLTEGMTAADMARRIGESHVGHGITAEAYLKEMRTGTFNMPLPALPRGVTLEGMLFPDSYDVPDNATAHDLIQLQLDTFGHKAAPILAGDPNPYQKLIEASLVEREARFADDQPKVASVIENRLAIGMRLQIDAAVLYGVGVTGRSPTTDELQRDTPFNTYLHTGLPPAPISNPGVAAISATLQPAKTAFLFYVSDRCGHNHYTQTGPEHDQAVARYLDAPC
jgi:UPF0755 protein